MSESATPSPTSTAKSTPSFWRRRPLLPLAVCLLTLLTLTDRFFPSLTRPQSDPAPGISAGVRSFLEGVVTEPPHLSGGEEKVVIDMASDIASSKILLTFG